LETATKAAAEEAKPSKRWRRSRAGFRSCAMRHKAVCVRASKSRCNICAAAHEHCCAAARFVISRFNPVHTLQAKRGFNKVWARAIRSLPSDKETDTDEDGRRRFDFHQVSDNPPVLLGRIPYDTQTTSPPSLCINSGHRIHGRTAPPPRWLHC